MLALFSRRGSGVKLPMWNSLSLTNGSCMFRRSGTARVFLVWMGHKVRTMGTGCEVVRCMYGVGLRLCSPAVRSSAW